MTYRMLAPAGLGPMKQVQASEDRDRARDILRTGLDTWCERTLAGVDKGERNAMTNYAKVMGLMGGDEEMAAALAVQRVFGMALTELQRLVEMQRTAADITLDESEADGIALLKLVLQQEPTRRMKILSALGGTDAVLVQETNGTNGAH
jgi:hypothetical protein